jgi:O-antigen/teichoic acid export membrane protein
MVIYANIYFSQIVIRHYSGEKILGIYLSANIFAGILGVVQYGFTNYWSVFMFENYSTNQSLIKRVHDYVSVFAVLTLCAFVLMKDLLYLFIGPQFQASKPIFALVLTAPLFTMICETTAYGISIEKKAHLSLISYSLYFILNLLLAVVLVPIWGMLGAALSLMISAFINLIIQTIIGQRYYKSVETLKRTAYATGIIVLLAALNYRFDGNRIVTLCITAVIILVSLIVYYKPLEYAFILIKNSNSNSKQSDTGIQI